MKFRCRIKIIFLSLLVSAPLSATGPWEAGVWGVHSTAWRTLPASPAYASANASNQSIDLGGRIAHKTGPGYLGFRLGLYTAFGLREDVSIAYATAQPSGLGYAGAYTGGNYRIALAWAGTLITYRYYFFDLLFAEGCVGPAFGFGAIEATFTGSTTGAPPLQQYHRYSEWGSLTSATLGVRLPLAENLHAEVAFEFAWVYARIRHPDISNGGDFLLSQTFYRPGLGVAFRF